MADSGNHRVVVFPQPLTSASRVLGQLSLDYTAPNLIEGRELNLALVSGTTLIAPGGGVAIDAASDPPRLYVADTFNHRVLGFKDARKIKPGDTADLVIGQPDLFRSGINYPTNEAAQTTDSGLRQPTSLAVDSQGNLYVADSGNSRVLRFPRPFDPANPRALPRANLVLGQTTFFPPKIIDPSRRNLALPFGLAFTPEGHLLVSDSAHHRALLFRKPAGGDFTNGMEASAHFGQADFTSIGASSADNRFNTPRGLAVDTSGRLYVADTGNNRVMIFASAATTGPDDDPRPAVTLLNSINTSTRLRSPVGISVSSQTGEIWVAEIGGNRVLRYPEFGFLPANNFVANAALPSNAPLAVMLDGFGNPVVSELVHRVAMFFPATVGVNAANYLNRPVAPGTYVALYPVVGPLGGKFGFQETKRFDELPNPIPMAKELADIQVLIDDKPVPLHFVSPGQINFYMPMSAPTSGTVEALVLRPSTGQVIAASSLRMDVASPGLFTAAATGSGQLAALNQDNSVNSPGNAAARGTVVQLFGTGQGAVPNAPPDGEPASGLTPTDEKPRVFIGTDFVPDADVQYSGLAPDLIGVWQINFKIPDRVAPSSAVLVYVQHKNIPSMTAQTRATIAVKQ